MKTKYLFLLLPNLLFLAVQSAACPIYRVGKILVVDEMGKPITDAKIWRFYCADDSFLLSHSDHWGEDMDDKPNPIDTISFNLYSSAGGWYDDENDCLAISKEFLVQAPGYADLEIQGIDFQYSRKSVMPILKVVMYHTKYIMKGNQVYRFEKYACNKSVEVKDSFTLQIQDYTEALYTESSVAEAERVISAGICTYPNPVKDNLNIEINDVMLKPYKAVLSDLQGKTIRETELTESLSELDMTWESQGMYFISVYDGEGVLKYCMKFLKA